MQFVENGEENMEKELFEKLQLIAENYDKTSDLRSYVQNGRSCINAC